MSRLVYAWSEDKGGIIIVLCCDSDDADNLFRAHVFEFEPLIGNKLIVHIDLILIGFQMDITEKDRIFHLPFVVTWIEFELEIRLDIQYSSETV